MVHRSGSIALIRASPVRARLCRALLASALFAGSLGLAGCNTDVYQLPTRAMKELSPEMLALLGQKGMPRESPILVRIFKEESELEVWKQDTTGRFELLKVYPICRWSGDLGPKVKGRRPSGARGLLYDHAGLMNPNSNYYLAINTGFPNAYDRANGRSGGFLMIHGDCSSRGCYAMTDEQIGEIYSLARESFLGGQQSFQIQAYPFRMTRRTSRGIAPTRNMPFWKMIKDRQRSFRGDASWSRRSTSATALCVRRPVPGQFRQTACLQSHWSLPGVEVSPQLAALARDKVATRRGTVHAIGQVQRSGGADQYGYRRRLNRVFIAQIENSSRTVDSEGHVHVVLPPAGSVPETTGAVADNSASQPSLASRLFGRMFGSKSSGNSTRVASADANAGTQQRSGGFFSNLFSSRSSNSPQQANPAGAARGPELPAGAATASQKSKPAAHSDTHTEVAAAPAGVRAKPRIEAEASAPQKAEPQPQKMEPQETVASKPKPAAQQEANAGAPGSSGAVLSGAQRAVPAGSFENRWTGMQ